MVAESGKLSKSGLDIGENGCFGAAISKPLMAEIGRLLPVAALLPVDPKRPVTTGAVVTAAGSVGGVIGRVAFSVVSSVPAAAVAKYWIEVA